MCVHGLFRRGLVNLPRHLELIFLLVLLFLAVTGKLFYPAVYEDRVSRPDNVYQRIAQDQQTLEVVRDHPLMGVGFNLYHDTVFGDAKYTCSI